MDGALPGLALVHDLASVLVRLEPEVVATCSAAAHPFPAVQGAWVSVQRCPDEHPRVRVAGMGHGRDSTTEATLQAEVRQDHRRRCPSGVAAVRHPLSWARTWYQVVGQVLVGCPPVGTRASNESAQSPCPPRAESSLQARRLRLRVAFSQPQRAHKHQLLIRLRNHRLFA